MPYGVELFPDDDVELSEVRVIYIEVVQVQLQGFYLASWVE